MRLALSGYPCNRFACSQLDPPLRARRLAPVRGCEFARALGLPGDRDVEGALHGREVEAELLWGAVFPVRVATRLVRLGSERKAGGGSERRSRRERRPRAVTRCGVT